MTKNTKKDDGIDIHQNYVLFSLFSMLSNIVTTIMIEIQRTTPYGDEYENAYKLYSSKMLKTINEFSRVCRKCQELQKKGKHNDER